MRAFSLSLFAALLFSAEPRAEPVYRGGAVATAHPAATQAALSTLDAGGNAVDAVVAAAFTLAVVGPYHSGLGGGGFAIWQDAWTGRVRALDFREVAPHKAATAMFLRGGKPVPELSRDGALAVAVPGEVAGLLALHEAGGRLPRAKVLGPAIAAARTGFLVTPIYQRTANARLACLRADSEATRIFLRPDEEGAADVPALGELLRQPELAGTLEAIAARGADAFYTGAVARSLARTVVAGGGILSEQDLTDYRPRWRTPLEGQYRGHRVVTMPPPSAGGITLLQVLGILERLRPDGFAFHDAEAVHLYVEALRRSFFDRADSLGDPSFVDVPVARLLSDEHLRALANSIDSKHASPSISLSPVKKNATPLPLQKHTTHISVVDRDGNAVALTATVNYLFGACLVAKGTGVLLNDEMDDFAAAPGAPNTYGLVMGEANNVAPGKEPVSSMTPTLVFQRARPLAVMLVVGSPGGPTIPTTVFQVVSNVIDVGMDIEHATAAGRVHHQYLPDEVWVEPWGTEPATLRVLEAKGHQLRRVDGWGAAMAVRVDPETSLRTAAADPRSEGTAAGQP